MIFGIIAAAFLISFTVYYLQSYIGLQEDVQRGKILNNFEMVYEDVYLTGNAVDFNQFSQVKFNLNFDVSEPAGIVSTIAKEPFRVLVLFSPGEKVFIDDGELDMKWFKLRYVMIMPPSRIIFVPTQNTDAVWTIIQNITEHMPDSTGFKNRITFGFCSGNVLKENFCGEDEKALCDKKEFLEKIRAEKNAPGFSDCTKTVSNIYGEYRFVKISSSCSPPSRGICVTTPDSNGIGRVYINGSQEYYIYKDPLDIVSILVGYDHKNIYGIAGENLYIYKNREFAKRVSIAADMMAKRAVLIAGEIENVLRKNQLDFDSKDAQCLPIFQQFSLVMNQINSILSNKEYYKGLTSVITLKTKLDEAERLHSKLIEMGCDYEI
jgi:hypothetical protein